MFIATMCVSLLIKIIWLLDTLRFIILPENLFKNKNQPPIKNQKLNTELYILKNRLMLNPVKVSVTLPTNTVNYVLPMSFFQMKMAWMPAGHP